MTGEKGPDVFWRYVYLDGSQDIYDRHLRQRLPAGAVKLALGDAFATWQNDERRRVIPAENLLFDPRMTECPADTINTFEGLPLPRTPIMSGALASANWSRFCVMARMTRCTG